jgi:hypothetical protein
LLAVAHWCGLLHRRWRQRGVNVAAADTFFALFTEVPRRGVLGSSGNSTPHTQRRTLA